MAFSGNFNRKADSHLVCVETDGTHATQTISCRTSSKKREHNLVNLDFVIFSGMFANTLGIFFSKILFNWKFVRSCSKSLQFSYVIK